MLALLGRVLGFLKPYSLAFLLSLIAMFAWTGLELLLPQLVRYAIDNALRPGGLAVLGQMVLATLGVGLLRSAVIFIHAYSSEYAAQRAAYDLRSLFYDHLQRLPFAFHDKAQTGELMSRATRDVETIRRFLANAPQTVGRNATTFVGVLAICFWMNWRLALVALCAYPLLVVSTLKFRARVRPVFRAMRESEASMTAFLQEVISGVRVVKAFAREEEEVERFSVEAGTVFRNGYEFDRLWALYDPYMGFLAALGTSAVLWFGGQQVIRGELSLGALVAFNSYLLMLMGPVRMLGWVVNIMARCTTSAERLFEVLEQTAEVREDPKAGELRDVQGRVRFDHVSFSYDGVTPVLTDVTFEARPGETIAIIGATGSGKTSIINLLPRFYDPTEGRITIDGTDIRKVTLASLRRHIGMVLQETYLFSATLRENIAYGKTDATEEEVVAAARQANIHDFIASLPEGYDTHVGERGVTLSGGQKQRVAIARALLMDPRILVLDDSTSSVDTETEHLIQQALRGLMRNRTSLVIAQRFSTVKDADRIVVLEGGRVAEMGTHDELYALGGLYTRLCDLQLRGAHRMVPWDEAAGLGSRQ